MSYVLIHIIHKASVNHPQASATSGPAHYRGHADSGAADKRIKDLARLSVLITYNTPINYTHTAAHSPPLNHWPAAGNDKCFLFAIFYSLIIILFIGILSVFRNLNNVMIYFILLLTSFTLIFYHIFPILIMEAWKTILLCPQYRVQLCWCIVWIWWSAEKWDGTYLSSPGPGWPHHFTPSHHHTDSSLILHTATNPLPTLHLTTLILTFTVPLSVVYLTIYSNLILAMWPKKLAKTVRSRHWNRKIWQKWTKLRHPVAARFRNATANVNITHFPAFTLPILCSANQCTVTSWIINTHQPKQGSFQDILYKKISLNVWTQTDDCKM